MRVLKIYSQQISSTQHSTVNYSHQAIYIGSSGLSLLITESVYPLTNTFHPPASQALGKHHSTCCSVLCFSPAVLTLPRSTDLLAFLEHKLHVGMYQILLAFVPFTT